MSSPFAFLGSAQFLGGVLTGGGLLTIWKWVAGWNKTNLTVCLALTRQGSSVPDADLVCTVTLKKGDRATLGLQSVCVVVADGDKKYLEETLKEIEVSTVSRTLNITPGEEAQFAAYAVVPSDAVCKATVTMIAHTLRIRRAPVSAWRTTGYSIPRPVEVAA